MPDRGSSSSTPRWSGTRRTGSSRWPSPSTCAASGPPTRSSTATWSGRPTPTPAGTSPASRSAPTSGPTCPSPGTGWPCSTTASTATTSPATSSASRCCGPRPGPTRWPIGATTASPTACSPTPGDLREAGVIDAGYDLNVPVRAVATSPHPGPLEPDGSLLSVDAAHVVVEAVKRRRRRPGALVVRLYEAWGRRGPVTLQAPWKLRPGGRAPTCSNGSSAKLPVGRPRGHLRHRAVRDRHPPPRTGRRLTAAGASRVPGSFARLNSTRSRSELAGELEHGLVVGLTPKIEQTDGQRVTAVAHRPIVIEDGIDDAARPHRPADETNGSAASLRRTAACSAIAPVPVEPGGGLLARAQLEHVGVDRAREGSPPPGCPKAPARPGGCPPWPRRLPWWPGRPNRRAPRRGSTRTRCCRSPPGRLARRIGMAAAMIPDHARAHWSRTGRASRRGCRARRAGTRNRRRHCSPPPGDRRAGRTCRDR